MNEQAPNLQEMMVEIGQLRAELDTLKQRTQALAHAETSSNGSISSTISRSRRTILKRLGLAILGGAAAITSLAILPENVRASVIANPSINSLANKVGMLVLPPNADPPTTTSLLSHVGVIASGDTTTLKLNRIPEGNIGVFGSGANVGVYGFSSTGIGVYAQSNDTFAGFFEGDVNIQGNLTKTGGTFKIDHPLDPANKYLYHSFVESPDMLNIYNGNVILNGQGEAVVEMPDWFDALNSDFRYQLTCLGEYAPVFIAEKLVNRRFKIAGGKANQEISWLVTGIRQDAWAKNHRVPIEVAKSENEKGRYLHPELFGQSAEMSVGPRALKVK